MNWEGSLLFAILFLAQFIKRTVVEPRTVLAGAVGVLWAPQSDWSHRSPCRKEVQGARVRVWSTGVGRRI